jgi:hypothetical protein
MVGGHGGIVKPVANVFRSKGGGGSMDLFFPEREHVAHIPRTSHDGEAFPVEVVSIMELHRCMGHIAPASARNLVGDGLVTDIALDQGSLEEHDPVLRLHVVTPSACSKGPSRQASPELQ